MAALLEPALSLDHDSCWESLVDFANKTSLKADRCYLYYKLSYILQRLVDGQNLKEVARYIKELMEELEP